jgi:hypothetical protein
MDANHLPYVHLLLFRCAECDGPIALSIMREELTLEGVDGKVFDLNCKCGSSRARFGVEASRHWVVLWRGYGVDHSTEFRQESKQPFS